MKKETKETIREELQQIGSSLPGHSGQPGLEVPGDYFGKFPQVVQQRIALRRNNGLGLIQAFSTKLIPIAASLALLVALIFSFQFRQSGKDQASLSEAEEALYENYFSSVSEYDRSLIYDITPQEMLQQEQQAEVDPMLEYVIHMAELYGIGSRELIAGLD